MEKAFLITLKSDINKIIAKKNIDILYFWDWECEFNFISMINNQNLIWKLKKSWKKITLLTPHLTEKSLNNFIVFIKNNTTLFNKDVISEIVINDLWVLNILNKLLKDKVKLIYWNYLFSQSKDPFAKESKRNDSILNIDYSMYNKFFKDENITSIELFNSFWNINIKNIELNINLYYPYVIQNTTRYCLRNQIYNNIDYKKIIDGCSWCHNKRNLKFKQDKLWINIYSSWNKNYYSNFSYKNLSKNITRIIYNYDII